jgi:copper(I)-binding protein
MRAVGRVGVCAAAVLGLALAGCRVVPVQAPDVAGVSNAYLVMPAPGSPAVLYLWARNPSPVAVTILAVWVAGADSASAHGTMAMGNGMEHMMAIGAVAVPARDTIRFAPGGMHVMVFGPPPTLHPGDSVQVTVGFRRMGEVNAWATVITYAQVDSLVERGR